LGAQAGNSPKPFIHSSLHPLLDAPAPQKPAEPYPMQWRRTLLELANWQDVAERMRARNSTRKLPHPEPPAEDAPGAPQA